MDTATAHTAHTASTSPPATDAARLDPRLVTVVMRTIGGRPREIRRAIASVAASSWRPVEVVVVYQGSEDAQWADIQRLPHEFAAIPVRALRNANTGDRRAENLNIGWEAGNGRYLGFLDDDDTLEPQHLPLLVDAMEASGRAWAYGQVVLRKEDEALAQVSESRPFRRHRFSLQSLWNENFLPIHSLLIDRSRLAPPLRARPVCEELDRSEDWDFLLRLAFAHEPAVVEAFTCTYHVSTGERNTNLSLMAAGASPEREQRNREAWARCKTLVEQRKASLIAPLWWAREHFNLPEAPAPAQAPTQAPGQPEASVVAVPVVSFRRRAVRKLIRMLERLL
ncbi:MAG TPA: glycosyltransferase family 2 protein [Ramlibacter sp.]|nr:glycosyltransferase family 2 protein [Ramlibacter sp.]